MRANGKAQFFDNITTVIGCCGLRNATGKANSKQGYWGVRPLPRGDRPMAIPYMIQAEHADWVASDGGLFVPLGAGFELFVPPGTEVRPIDLADLQRVRYNGPVAVGRNARPDSTHGVSLAGISAFRGARPDAIPSWDRAGFDANYTVLNPDNLGDLVRRYRETHANRITGPFLLHGTLAGSTQKTYAMACVEAGLELKYSWVNQNSGNVIWLFTRVYE